MNTFKKILFLFSFIIGIQTNIFYASQQKPIKINNVDGNIKLKRQGLSKQDRAKIKSFMKNTKETDRLNQIRANQNITHTIVQFIPQETIEEAERSLLSAVLSNNLYNVKTACAVLKFYEKYQESPKKLFYNYTYLDVAIENTKFFTNPMLTSSYRSRQKLILTALIKNGCPITNNTSKSWDKSTMYVAAYNLNTMTIKVLFRNGSSINARAHLYNTPLQGLAHRMINDYDHDIDNANLYASTLDALLYFNADPEIKDLQGLTPSQNLLQRIQYQSNCPDSWEPILQKLGNNTK